MTTISNAAKHSLLYDYGGFPRQAYELTYDAPGDPDIAQLVSKRLAEAGVKTKMDSRRGKRLILGLPSICNFEYVVL